ncbi:MAG: hypothetical protein QXI01_06780 [Nitrososphaerota archaeon]
MVTEVELFASSPRLFLGLLSVKLFNDAVNAGLTDTLAATMDIAVRSMNGADQAAILLDHPGISVSTVASILNSTNIEVPQVVAILGSTKLRSSKAASILSNVNFSANKAQSTLYMMVDNGYYEKFIDIITYGASDASITANTTITGVKRYRNLSIVSGVTLTVDGQPGVIIADTISNSGTIAKTVTGAAGGAPGATGAGAGGRGGGGLILIARNMTVGTVTADGAAGASASTVAASGAGGAGTGGLFWIRSGDTIPSGGNGGYSNGGAGRPNSGGGGGGGSSGGAGGSATTTTFTTGKDLAKEILKCVADWWLVNVAGKTPTTVKSIPSICGSGGGGGAAYDAYTASGGGGGGGGEIIAIAVSMTAGTFYARGGAGGNGGTEGLYDSGGGGGGGGVVYVFYVNKIGTNTFNVSGGAGGTGDYNGTAGGAGFGVEIYIG